MAIIAYDESARAWISARLASTSARDIDDVIQDFILVHGYTANRMVDETEARALRYEAIEFGQQVYKDVESGVIVPSGSRVEEVAIPSLKEMRESIKV